MTKRIVLMLLGGIILLSGCAAKDQNETIQYLEQASIDFVYHENTEEHAIAFQVKNQGEKKISELLVSIIAYDATGNILMASEPVRNVQIQSADLEVGASKIYRVSDSGLETSVFYRAIVTKIIFSDALEVVFEQTEAWISQQGSSINVNQEKEKLQTYFSKMYESAISDQPLEITSIEQKTINDAYPNQGISLKIKNLQEDKVTSFKLMFVVFDSNDQPLSVGEVNQLYVNNNKLLPYEGTIGANAESGVLKAESFFPEGTVRFAYIVLEVNYESQAQWRNQNAVGWAIHQSQLYVSE